MHMASTSLTLTPSLPQTYIKFYNTSENSLRHSVWVILLFSLVLVNLGRI